MLTQLVVELDSNQLNFFKGSVMQGALFEHIDSDYADWLHEMQIHPYSQYVHRLKDGKTEWVISTLNDEARSYIIDPLLDADLTHIKIRKGNLNIKIVSKKVSQLDIGSLKQKMKQKNVPKSVTFDVITPAAFKRAGSYFLLPEPEIIFQSLINRYRPLDDTIKYDCESLIQNLGEAARITDYRLRTLHFPLEGTAVPGFMGTFSITIRSSEYLRRAAYFFARFGEYSGIGIKTAMGMGAIRVRN